MEINNQNSTSKDTEQHFCIVNGQQEMHTCGSGWRKTLVKLFMRKSKRTMAKKREKKN